MCGWLDVSGKVKGKNKNLPSVVITVSFEEQKVLIGRGAKPIPYIYAAMLVSEKVFKPRNGRENHTSFIVGKLACQVG